MSELTAIVTIKKNGMRMRLLTNETRRRVDEIISRLANGESVTLEERIQLNKYALHIPFVAGKIKRALRKVSDTKI